MTKQSVISALQDARMSFRAELFRRACNERLLTEGGANQVVTHDGSLTFEEMARFQRSAGRDMMLVRPLADLLTSSLEALTSPTRLAMLHAGLLRLSWFPLDRLRIGVRQPALGETRQPFSIACEQAETQILDCRSGVEMAADVARSMVRAGMNVPLDDMPGQILAELSHETRAGVAMVLAQRLNTLTAETSAAQGWPEFGSW